MVGKVALTQNGNEYKKTNAGKIVGVATGAAAFSTIGLAAARNKIATGVTGLKGNGDFFVLAGLVTVIGTIVGTVIDFCINHERQQQADGEAARKNLSKNA